MSAVKSNVQQSRSDGKRLVEVTGLTPENVMKVNLGYSSCHPNKENSISGHYDQVDQDTVSDCESGISGSSSCNGGEDSSLVFSGFVRLHEEEMLHQMISFRFTFDLARYGLQTDIQAIHRNANTGVAGTTNLQSYMNFLRDMENKNDGSANWKYAWYCGSKQDIDSVLSHGFGHSVNTGIYGRGIYLSPVEYPLQSLPSSTADENGLRHLLLCRVILGRTEIIRPGSEQCHPSSEEFDSGVDNLLTPNKYIVWSTHMNTHIYPEFVISIRAPTIPNGRKFSVPLRRPKSPWMPFPALISTLSEHLAPSSAKLIQRLYADHREKKMAREELIKRVRQIAGDELLIRSIKSYKNKLETAKGSKQLKSVRGGDCACSKNGSVKSCRMN